MKNLLSIKNQNKGVGLPYAAKVSAFLGLSKNPKPASTDMDNPDERLQDLGTLLSYQVRESKL